MIPIGVINSFLYLLFTLLDISILAEVILSYIPSVRESNFYKILVSFNNQILSPFRTFQEKEFGRMIIEFAPLLAIVVLNFISGILI